MRYFLIYPLLLAGACLLMAEPALADELHETRWGDFAWRVLNLIIFCGILWYFTGKLIKRFFHNRRQGIQDTLDELEARRKQARESLAEIEKRIANLESEREAILAESRAQAERMKQGIVDDANRQASQIVDQARRAAENESRAMLDEVRAKLADEIIEAARKALAGQLTEEDHDRLIANSLDKVALQ